MDIITPCPKQRSTQGEAGLLPVLIPGPGVKTVSLLSQRRQTEAVSKLLLTQGIAQPSLPIIMEGFLNNIQYTLTVKTRQEAKVGSKTCIC